MNVVDLGRLDLNLLVSLHVLLDERSTTRAGRRLGRTQSAMSHALGRLREMFDDPLLVRQGRRLERTERGDALQVPVRRALEAFYSVVFDASRFDPATARREFTISSSEYIQLAWLPRLLERLADEAPGIDVRVVPPLEMRQTADAMARGELDLAAVVVSPPSSLSVHPLFEDDFVLMVDRGHPLTQLARPVSLEAFASYPQVLTAPSGRRGAFLDPLLERAGLSRRVVAVTGHFMVAPRLLHGSQRVLAIPRRMARLVHQELGLDVLELDFETPVIQARLVWHRRSDEDAGHRWFRQTLTESC